jgi:hypothetical protein
VRSELDLFGVFIPGLLVCLVAALLLNGLLRRVLAFAGFYRFVWHRHLFDLAMFIALLALVVGLSATLGWR